MKYLAAVIAGIVSAIFLALILTPQLNNLYIFITGAEPGPDTEDTLIDFFFYVEVPTYFVIGAVLGLAAYKKLRKPSITSP